MTHLHGEQSEREPPIKGTERTKRIRKHRKTTTRVRCTDRPTTRTTHWRPRQRRTAQFKTRGVSLYRNYYSRSNNSGITQQFPTRHPQAKTGILAASDQWRPVATINRYREHVPKARLTAKIKQIVITKEQILPNWYAQQFSIHKFLIYWETNKTVSTLGFKYLIYIKR